MDVLKGSAVGDRMNFSIVSVCQDVSAQALVCVMLCHVAVEPGDDSAVVVLYLTDGLRVAYCDEDALNCQDLAYMLVKF